MSLARLAERDEFTGPNNYVLCHRSGRQRDASALRRHYKRGWRRVPHRHLAAVHHHARDYCSFGTPASTSTGADLASPSAARAPNTPAPPASDSAIRIDGERPSCSRPRAPNALVVTAASTVAALAGVRSIADLASSAPAAAAMGASRRCAGHCRFHAPLLAAGQARC